MTTPVRPWWQLFLEKAGGTSQTPGFTAMLGITPESWQEGSCTLRWHPPSFTRTGGGWVQGGFLGVVLDMAQTIAVFSTLPDGVGPQTLEMKVSFVEAPVADDFLVTGRVVRRGRTAAHTDGEVRDVSGKLVATSTSTHVISASGGSQLPPDAAPESPRPGRP